ncbi:MAG: hypothetical protein COA69_03765 [Robiginitomaculum sp.]|nr:MAG: hypothetical protein COA69_03765 [Robiginitomaculum sp.]
MAELLKFDNVLNVRDFGGHALEGGRMVACGQLFRGAQISNTSSQDRSQFADYGISLIVDFRYRSERKRQTSRFDANFNPEVLELLKDHDQGDEDHLAPHESFILHELESAEDARRYMINSYTERPDSPAFISLTARAFKRMADSGEAIYVHCAAGKDRTGTFAALLLLLLGVSDADVMDDYLRTREALEFSLIKNMAAKKMEERYGRVYDPDALEPFFGVEPEFLLKSLDVIGDVERYAKTVLGLTGTDLANLRRHYHAAS